MIQQLGLLTDPETTLESHSDSSALLQFEYLHNRDYAGESPLELSVICENHQSGPRCLITTSDKYARGSKNASLAELATALGQPVLDLTSPLPLSPLTVEKPWGKEIWYSGVEQRGICRMGGVPIPWILDCFPRTVSGQTYQPPILLKVLAPHAHKVLGDLYFEAHAKKTEVYVVTDIDRSAWPEGKGKIRFGFSKQKQTQYNDINAFKQAYLEAVNRYQEIRNQIDRQMDKTSSGDETDLATRLNRLSKIDPELQQEEQNRRQLMDSFTQTRDLELGDVVQVPPLTPHALQHGVTVVEFQSPYYERYILSFAQKVLTQDHWDTKTALDKISYEPDHQLATTHGEVIADFDEFTVHRVQLAPGETSTLDHPGYAMIMGVIGQVSVAGVDVLPHSAFYLPAGCTKQLNNNGNEKSTTLLALPNLNP